MNCAVLDTNVLIRLLKSGDRQVVDALSQFDCALLSPVVLAEFESGLNPSTSVGELQKRALDEFRGMDSVREIGVLSKTAQFYSRIFRHLKAQGTPIPMNDIWIAASALEHGAMLVTADAHFEKIPMLPLALVRDR